MFIKIDHTILIDFNRQVSEKHKKNRFMAGDKATVAKHSLMKQDWLFQYFILPIYFKAVYIFEAV